MEKITIDVLEMMGTLYSDLPTDQVISNIKWLDENTTSWPFDRIRELAAAELSKR